MFTHENVQLWMLPPISYGIAAEQTFPVVWFGVELAL